MTFPPTWKEHICKISNSWFRKLQMLDEEIEMYEKKIQQVISMKAKSRLSRNKSIPSFEGNSAEALSEEL